MNEVLEFLRVHGTIETLYVVFGAAAVEYVLPPLPGDTIVVASSLLVLAGTWSFGTVFVCVIAGGLLGSYLQYGLGQLLSDKKGGFRGEIWIRRLFGDQSTEGFVEAFRKYGYWVIVFNRFMPGVRAGVVFMAGAFGLKLRPIMMLGLLSTIAWSGLLLGLGITIGHNFEKIQAVLSVYRYSAGGIIVALIGVFAYRNWVRSTKEGS